MDSRSISELRKGERSIKLTPQMKRRLFCMTALVTVVIYLCTAVDVIRNDSPSGLEIRNAVYGNSPLGLPWEVVHFVAFAVLWAPLSVWIFSGVHVWALSAELGRPVTGILSFVRCYRELCAIPELRPHVRRVALVSLWYFAVFVWWMIFTSIKGI